MTFFQKWNKQDRALLATFFTEEPSVDSLFTGEGKDKFAALETLYPFLAAELLLAVAESASKKIHLLLSALKEKIRTPEKKLRSLTPFAPIPGAKATEMMVENKKVVNCERGFLLPRAPMLAIVCTGALQEMTGEIPKLGIVEPKGLFGSLSIIDGTAIIDAVAREPTTLVLYTKRDLEQMKEESPTVWLQLNRMLAINAIEYLPKLERQLSRAEII